MRGLSFAQAQANYDAQTPNNDPDPALERWMDACPFVLSGNTINAINADAAESRANFKYERGRYE